MLIISENEIEFDDKTGYLKSGIYPITISDLKIHPVFAGNQWRKQLIRNFEKACTFYWSLDIENILLNGSFVIQKPQPGDIDAILYFEEMNDKRLFKLNKSKSIWADFKPQYKDNKFKFPMWHEHKIEFLIHPLHVGTTEMTILELFQQSRNNEPKGLLKVIRN
jgi:hypothetical protein